MKMIGRLCIALALSACASLGPGGEEVVTAGDMQLWADAHEALNALQFGRADTLFARLARDHAATDAGRESLFFLGAIRIDPRNPGWDPARSETALAQYLALDTVALAPLGRRPEGQTLYEIARQLNLPPQDRLPALQPGPAPAPRPAPRVVSADRVTELTTEVARLREQLNTREADVRRLEEELERIRRTLAAPP